jgi:L-lactate permease
VATLLAFFVWQVSGTVIAASFIQGVSICIDILWIVFGALFMLNTPDQLRRHRRHSRRVHGYHA